MQKLRKTDVFTDILFAVSPTATAKTPLLNGKKNHLYHLVCLKSLRCLCVNSMHKTSQFFRQLPLIFLSNFFPGKGLLLFLIYLCFRFRHNSGILQPMNVFTLTKYARIKFKIFDTICFFEIKIYMLATTLRSFEKPKLSCFT